jgi:hypothetical protein
MSAGSPYTRPALNACNRSLRSASNDPLSRADSSSRRISFPHD